MLILNAHQRAILLMVCAPTLWSIAGVFTRHLDAASGFEVTFWRSLFSALCVCAVLMLQQGWSNAVAAVRGVGRIGILSGFMWCTMFVCFMLALTRTTVANTLIVMSVAPLLTAVLARVVLRQEIALRTWLAIMVALVGMIGMFMHGIRAFGGMHLTGMLIAGAVPVASAVNMVVLKRSGKAVDLMPAVLLGSVFSSVLMLPFAWPLQASMHDIVLLAILGVFQLGLPCMMMVKASAALTAPEMSLLALIEVLLGPVWAWLGAGEVPSNETLVGGAVVMAALMFNEVAGMRKPTTVRSAT